MTQEQLNKALHEWYMHLAPRAEFKETVFYTHMLIEKYEQWLLQQQILCSSKQEH